MVASSIGSSEEVYVYDSVDKEIEEPINALFCSTNIVFKKCQSSGVDCGLFAVVIAIALASGMQHTFLSRVNEKSYTQMFY